MAGPAKRPGSTFVAAAGRAGACEWLGGTRPPGQLVTWVLGAVPAVLGLSGWNVHPQTAGLSGHARPERYPGRPKQTQELQKLTAPASRGEESGAGRSWHCLPCYPHTVPSICPEVEFIKLFVQFPYTTECAARDTGHTGRRRCPSRCFG